MAGSRETKLVVGLVSGSHFIVHTYLVLLPPIFGILSGEFEVGLAALGLAMGAQGLVNTVFQLPYGYLSDNHSRMLALGLTLGFGAAGALITAAAPSYLWLIAGQAVLGLGVAAHHAAHYPLLADATPEEYRGRAFSVHSFAGNLGFAAPPAIITAVLAAGFTWRHAIGLIGAAGAVYGTVALLALSRYASPEVRLPPEDAGPSEAPIGERIREEARSIAASPAILAIATFALVTSTARWGLTSFAVVLLTDGYGVALETANLALTGLFVASAVTIIVGGELADRLAPGPVIVASYVALGVGMAVLGSFVLPALAAVALVLAVGAARGPSTPARSKLTDQFSARGDIGRNFAVITVGVMIGNGVAPPLFGAMIDTAGLGTAFAAIAALSFVGVLVIVAILRSYGDGLSLRVPEGRSG